MANVQGDQQRARRRRNDSDSSGCSKRRQHAHAEHEGQHDRGRLDLKAAHEIGRGEVMHGEQTQLEQDGQHR